MCNKWQELPEGDWLCCNDCTRIHTTLENLLVTGAERLPESLLDVIKKKRVERCLEPLNEIDVRWKLLNGKVASPETRPLLLEAVAMFNVSSVCMSCFITIIIISFVRVASLSSSWSYHFLYLYCDILPLIWVYEGDKLMILFVLQWMVELLCTFMIYGIFFFC